MNILFCLGSMDKGGAERVISNMANNLILNNNVSIVTTVNRKSEYYLKDEISIFSLDEDEKRTSNIKRIIKLRDIIKNVKPNIIISFQPEPSFRILALKIFNKIPTIVSVRNDPKIEYKNIKRKIFMKMLYPLADGYVFQTEEAKQYFSKKIQDKSIIIPNPINENFIVDEPYKGKREKTIVSVGRLEPQKNHKLLIDAFKEIVKKHKEYKLLIYGDGSLKNKLEEYTKDLGLSNNIIFKGKKDNIKEEIYNARMFVLSSNYEGMPNALMEAMALGLPCISTNCPCGGPRTLINTNINGILVKVNDVNEMKNAINKIIEDEELSQKIENNAIKIKEEYAPDKIMNIWKKYIINIQEKKNEN